MSKKTIVGLGSVLAFALGSSAALADVPQQGSVPQQPAQPGPRAEMQQGASRAQQAPRENAQQTPRAEMQQAPHENLQQGARTSAGTSGMQHGARVSISERFSRPALNNCAYQATVRGSVQEWMPTSGAQGSTGAPGAHQNAARGQGQGQVASASTSMYAPDLTITTRLRCADTASEQSSTSRLRGMQMTAQEFEAAVESRARVFTAAAGRVCAHTPDFRFEANRFSSQTLAQQCLQSTPAIGGGPQITGEAQDMNGARPSTGTATSDGGATMGTSDLPASQWQSVEGNQEVQGQTRQGSSPR